MTTLTYYPAMDSAGNLNPADVGTVVEDATGIIIHPAIRRTEAVERYGDKLRLEDYDLAVTVEVRP
jgi:hypothetical protein